MSDPRNTHSRQFFEKVFLKAHVESQHRGINFDQYMLDFGNANTVIHHHECELCGMGVLHTARCVPLEKCKKKA